MFTRELIQILILKTEKFDFIKKKYFTKISNLSKVEKVSLMRFYSNSKFNRSSEN